MCNVLKTAGHRAKRIKIGLMVLAGAYVSNFYFQFFAFSWESLSALCKIPDAKIFKRLLL